MPGGGYNFRRSACDRCPLADLCPSAFKA